MNGDVANPRSVMGVHMCVYACAATKCSHIHITYVAPRVHRLLLTSPMLTRTVRLKL